MEKNQDYQQALKRYQETEKKIHAMHYASSLFFWDSVTGAPKSGVEARSMAVEVISGLNHTFLINPQVDEDLAILELHADELTDTQRVQIREARKNYNKIAKIPIGEYKKYNALITRSEIAWEQCKEDSDFPAFQPYLQEIIDTLRRFSDYRGYRDHPYNPYLDDYEEGMDVKQLDVFFDALRKRIVPLLHRIREKGKVVDSGFFQRKFPLPDQETLSVDMLKWMGFDLSRGWFKESVHPFTIGIDMDDVRLTTHYYEKDFLSGFSSTVHEGGHAIYEQNIDPALRGTNLATGTSNGIHESQSRIYENNFLRSQPFCDWIYPEVAKRFSDPFKNVTSAMFYRAMNKVEPSLIRVDADELTYSLHIMLRYEIEQGLIDGSIRVCDLPEVWNAKMESYLGIKPPNDAMGVLQDVHWSAGLFGYFPSYALGNAYAAQIERALRREIDVDGCLGRGDFTPLTGWLSQKIHHFGTLKNPMEIMVEVTGEPLNPQYYCDYLEKKYTRIYDL
jgi:carboxypeptidase Taq